VIIFPPPYYHYVYVHLFASLVPRPPCPALSLAVRKAGGRPGRIYHVMRAAADVTFSLHAHIWVCSLSFTLLSLNSVRSFCSVCPVSPIATGLIIAIATVHDVSSGTHHVIYPSRPSPCFSYCRRQKLGIEAWERDYCLQYSCCCCGLSS